ncbi:MAG: hypothetical protein SGARI_007962, partial [Bacillariaceae sp.]
MGVRHTTLASLNANTTTGDDSAAILLESDEKLASLYSIDRYLYPGSGRMTRTFSLKNKQNGSIVVVKFMWLTQEELREEDGGVSENATTADNNNNMEPRLQQQQAELQRIQQALQGDTHAAPFLYWFVGPYRQYNTNTVRPAILVEKLWIVYQLLQALDSMHSKDIVHGFLTTENIGLSSWNWVALMDISSYKARTALPDDDPSEYLYYYQELFNQQGSDSTPREKRCYLAPERFYTPGEQGGDSGDKAETQRIALAPAMDIFSAGC